MNSRRLTLLSVVALAIIAGAVWIGFARKPSVETSAMLYPALKGQLAKVSAVQIYQASDQLAIEVTRTDLGWSLKQRAGYTADTAKINALLLGLEGAKLREEKTSNPDNYATLGVQDLTASGATGARVELVGIEPPVKLIVGKSDAMARAAYVRRAGEAKSWLISEQLTVPTDTASWLQRDLLNIGADRIQEAAVQVSGNPLYKVVKAQRADANFDVIPLPKGRELNSVSVANGIAQTLVSLQLEDVRLPVDLADQKSTAQTSFRTFDGLVIDVSGYSVDGKQWIIVKAGFDAALAKRFHMPTSAGKDAATTPDKSLEDAINKGRAEAEALNKQLGAGAYAIASYKYDAIFKPVDQLLKKQAELLPKKK